MAEKVTRVYNADEVTFSFADVLVEGGFADGEFVKIEEESDTYTDVVGADGEVAASKTNDRRATITLSLLQTAAYNKILSDAWNLGIASDGIAAGELLVRDRQGSTVFNALAWILKPPDVSLDRGVTPRAWPFRTGQLQRTDGANNVIAAS